MKITLNEGNKEGPQHGRERVGEIPVPGMGAIVHTY